MATATATATETSWDIAASIARIGELQPELAAGGFQADATNTDPTSNFEILKETGISGLLVPQRFGGAWDETSRGSWRLLIEAQTAVAAGDGPTGQNWGTTALVSREVFDEHNGLPDETKAEVARRILEEGLRLCAANAVTGLRTPPASARRVEGGIVLSGSKSFVTNSGGKGIALVGLPIEGEQVPYHALVELSDPNAVSQGDWDVMGQRGTQSNTYSFDGVFVPDGWYFAGHRPTIHFIGQAMLLHAGLNQGIGEGAYAEMIRYVKSMKRGSLPQFATPAEDPVMKRRIGVLYTRLAAAQALLFDTASKVETEAEDSDGWDEIAARAMASKIASVEASLAVGNELFDLTGARAASNAYRLDRYWRNARTFASHDPMDAKAVSIGGFALTGKPTDLGFQ
jgi:alkylation response protein AidB-like acyl-CoA dehydrogenase